MSRKYLIALLVFILLAGGAIAARIFGLNAFNREVNSLGLDLSAPDALLDTQSLATLPRDILKQPFAKKILTEDLAFYYEAHEDRLGVLGAIRRMAYEHDASFTDALLRRVLDEPAQVALWRDGKGALRHYIVSIKRTALTVFLEEAGKIVQKDTQLTRAGTISAGLGNAELYALTISPRRTFLFASRGERLVILSDPGMLLLKDKSIDSKAAAQVAKLLDASADPYSALFIGQGDNAKNPPTALAPSAIRHRFSINAQTFAFGYQKYFPAFEALQFSLDDKGNVTTALLVDPARTSTTAFLAQPLLQNLPAQPAVCALLPIDWKSASGVSDKLNAAQKVAAQAVLTQATGPVSGCWYADSLWESPLFATQLKEPSIVSLAQLQLIKTWALKKTESAALFGTGKVIVFSPDMELANQVSAVTEKRLANVADSLGSTDKSLLLALVTPSSLSRLIRKEAERSLTIDSEPHLRAAAQRHLWPRLDEFAKLPAFKVTLATDAFQGSRGWRPVSWQPLATP